MGVVSDQELTLHEEDYFELLSFFVSSALLLTQSEAEDELYPSLRLMDGASRLTQTLIANGGFEDQSWPREFVEACETHLDLVMTDEEAFVSFIQQMTGKLALEMKRRSKAGGGRAG